MLRLAWHIHMAALHVSTRPPPHTFSIFLDTFMRFVPSTSRTSTTANRQGRSSIVTLKLMRICTSAISRTG